MILSLICLLFTIGIYYGIKRLHRAVPKVYFSPVILTPIAVISMLAVADVSYPTYYEGARSLSDMIAPATIALAVPLYKNWDVLKKNAAAILTSVLAGSTVAIITSAWIANQLGLNLLIVESLVPRSATTPIAVVVSDFIGGIPAITAVFVLVTGVLGMLLGPWIIRLCRLKNQVSHGVLLGTSAHVVGTVKAFELSDLSGSISTIAMILTALFTLCTAPWLILLIL